MVQALPAPSLRELSRPKGVTEGVSSDGCFGLMVYSPAHINSEIFERLRSSKYTPSVSHSLDSSLREGAGNGRFHSSGCSLKSQVGGRFSSPLRNAKDLTLYHSSRYTPSVSPLGVTAPSEREPGGAVPFTRPPGNRNVAGDFHRPYGGAVPRGAGISPRPVSGRP